MMGRPVWPWNRSRKGESFERVFHPLLDAAEEMLGGAGAFQVQDGQKLRLLPGSPSANERI